MEPIQLTGLASGFDWKEVVDQLIEIERAPQNRLILEQFTIDGQLTALNDIKTTLLELQSIAADLQSSDLFFGRLANVDSTILSAVAASKTTLGSYAFDITQLATQSERVGALDVGAPINATADVSGVTLASMNLATAITAGTFTINGVQVTVDTADSLQDVFDAISTATSGQVTSSYDPVQDKILLSSASEIILGSPNDTSNFLSANKLFSNGSGSVSSSSSLGQVNLNSAIVDSDLNTAITNVDGNGDGTFTINGTVISFNVNDDSIRDLMERINDSDAKATISYDSVSDQFVLLNDQTGTLGLSVSESAGGFLEAAGLNSTSTFNLGDNAQFTVDGGGTLISTSNVLDDSVHGLIGLSVTAKQVGTETVIVESDIEDTRGKIEEFIEKYNAVQSLIKSSTEITVDDDEVTTSTLSSNREVTNLGRKLRNQVFASVSSLTGTIKRLQDMGIEFKTGSNELQIEDDAALDAALTNNQEEVSTLFSDATEGLSIVIDDFITNYTGTGGTHETQTDILDQRSKSLDEQIAALERRIENHRDTLTRSFIRMEEAQLNIQRQLDVLTSSFS